MRQRPAADDECRDFSLVEASAPALRQRREIGRSRRQHGYHWPITRASAAVACCAVKKIGIPSRLDCLQRSSTGIRTLRRASARRTDRQETGGRDPGSHLPTLVEAPNVPVGPGMTMRLQSSLCLGTLAPCGFFRTARWIPPIALGKLSAADAFGRNSERHTRCAARLHVGGVVSDRYDVVPHLWTTSRADIRQHLGRQLVHLSALRPRMVCTHSQWTARSVVRQ